MSNSTGQNNRQSKTTKDNGRIYGRNEGKVKMFQPDEWQQKALKTWYAKDNPLHLDPRHPLIKLAGEAGEILDLYGKNEYKPRFSWWDCKHCGVSRERLENVKNWRGGNIVQCCYDGPVPKVLDELGDWWYYLRIVTYQQGINIKEWASDIRASTIDDPLDCLAPMNLDCARILRDYQRGRIPPDSMDLWDAFLGFMRLLKFLDCTLDHLTELNYRKLNSEPTAHGWKK